MTQSVGRALAAEAMPENQGNKAQGIMTTAFHTGFLLGPTIGGLIIDYIHWRAAFFVLVPVSLLGSALAFWQMKAFAKPAKIQPIDHLGAVLLVAMTTSLILVLDQRIRVTLPAAFTLPVYLSFPTLLFGQKPIQIRWIRVFHLPNLRTSQPCLAILQAFLEV